MKSAQWTAVLVLALMVGGISFVTVYLGGNSSTGGDTTPTEMLPSLTFPVKVFPQEGEKTQVTEVRQSGHQDFWFINESGQDVTVGLNEKGCTCSEVEITVAPASWWPKLIGPAVCQALQLPPRGLENLTTLAAAYDLPELPENETTKMLTRENSTVVPAGAIGRARLSWRQEQVKRLNTYADLWMGQRGGSVSARLETNVFIAAPLDADKELTIPTVSEPDLEKMEKGQQAEIYCWSFTRPSFYLKAELLHNRLKPESDPVEIGEPIPLSRAELRGLEDRLAMHVLTVRSGYRIPVTVRAKAKDGTPIEWGHFRRTVQLSSSGEGVEPVQVKVTGEVRGDITVGGGKEGGTINLGPFPRKRGAHGDIVLQTDEKSIDLELDESRKPEYLRATLSKPKEAAGGHRSWVLSVEVPPGEVYGEFPRADNPVYRDSAIYVKTRGGKSAKSPRSIRIPVLGVANDS